MANCEFFSKFQISTNYENVILNFVFLSIALARQGTSAFRIKEKGLKKYIFWRKLRKCLIPEPLKTGISENRLYNFRIQSRMCKRSILTLLSDPLFGLSSRGTFV